MPKKENILLKILSSRNWFIYNKDLAFYLWTKEAILLGHLINKYGIHAENDTLVDWEWFYESRDYILLETGLNDQFQTRATKKLIDEWILEVRKLWIPARNYYRIIIDWLTRAIEEWAVLREEKIKEYRSKMQINNSRRKKDNNDENNSSDEETSQTPQNEVSEETSITTTDTLNWGIKTYQNEVTSEVDLIEQVTSKSGIINNNKVNNNKVREKENSNSLSYKFLKNFSKNGAGEILSIWNDITSRKDIINRKIEAFLSINAENIDIEDFQNRVDNYTTIVNKIKENNIEKLLFFKIHTWDLGEFLNNYNKFSWSLLDVLKNLTDFSNKSNLGELKKAFNLDKVIKQNNLEITGNDDVYVDNKAYEEQKKKEEEELNKKIDDYLNSLTSEEYNRVVEEFKIEKKIGSGWFLDVYWNRWNGLDNNMIRWMFRSFVNKKYLK